MWRKKETNGVPKTLLHTDLTEIFGKMFSIRRLSASVSHTVLWFLLCVRRCNIAAGGGVKWRMLRYTRCWQLFTISWRTNPVLETGF